ncbi:hypothetical protein MEI_00159 [Bartonella vinsonii subsp. arupensis Pm136co]|uniref:Protein-disulfide reductase n=1 Tax=Bartonella vinsonii subsp. arupensis Pm136co TaxID=1094561 RepID=A0ABP2QVR4_BARVI|nr:hypothetical protein [Bartonella vinsonii]EJF98992.1 hypothetical protein MEI_00159 [Bartonella vinsonii subsp. arupensis Pm136co]
MIKVLKNHMLSILIASAFFLSQVVNVHANHLSNNTQQEDVSIIEQAKKKAINIATLYVPSLNHGTKNKDATEGKIEKVFEPITLGTFTTIGSMLFGYFTGFLMAIFSGLIGIGIGKTKK